MLTAKLISRTEPTVDERANFYMAAADKSDAINKISVSMQIPFLAAVNEYNDEEVMVGVNKQASALNTLVDDLMATAPEDSSMLVVSYDLSISPAMAQRGIPLTSIDFLSGYVIKDDGSIAPFSPEVD